MNFYPILEPSLGDEEIANVLECLRTGWISSQGEFIHRLERDFEAWFDGGHAVAVSSGTSALSLALAALEIGRDDEVLVPDFTFAASANAIVHAGATPVLTEIDPDTWTLDVTAAERLVNSRTKAIMPVHIYGQPVHLDECIDLAQRHGLMIIEDCAESLGSLYKGRKVGVDGDCSCFSFFANKVMTTGEGGMLYTRDQETAEQARILRDHGMRPGKRYWHDRAGFNFRMTNMQAAIGTAQLGRLASFRERRKKLFELYDCHLAGDSRLRLHPRNDWSENSYWLYTVTLLSADEEHRDRVGRILKDKGVDSRPGFYPMHVMPPYSGYARTPLPVSARIAATTLSLPTSTALEDDDISHIARMFKAALDEAGL